MMYLLCLVHSIVFEPTAEATVEHCFFMDVEGTAINSTSKPVSVSHCVFHACHSSTGAAIKCGTAGSKVSYCCGEYCQADGAGHFLILRGDTFNFSTAVCCPSYSYGTDDVLNFAENDQYLRGINISSCRCIASGSPLQQSSCITFDVKYCSITNNTGNTVMESPGTSPNPTFFSWSIINDNAIRGALFAMGSRTVIISNCYIVTTSNSGNVFKNDEFGYLIDCSIEEWMFSATNIENCGTPAATHAYSFLNTAECYGQLWMSATFSSGLESSHALSAVSFALLFQLQ